MENESELAPWEMGHSIVFFLSAPHTFYGGRDSDVMVKCMEQDTEHIDLMYHFITNNIIVRVLNGSTVIVEFIGQWKNAANESIHLEIIIIIMIVRIIALLFFSCKETKREIKDLFQVYTF